MERYTIDVPDEAAASLREAAQASGVSVEDVIGGLVERTYAKRAPDDWVHELIAMTRPGIEMNSPGRMPWEREVPWEYDDFS
ncbi:hypothetical protein ACFSTD_08480 [Novosphingobium colocasiae]|uniref:Uncharacterized protein n=1 Tax=Novosphingobium colocasiae TaxID=1256513 RepID=A0A918PE38_9SPHN|nr:hypothetical protein [Novosphingobium colocasiae]GGZ01209.1 hypothetical protein GCM10011614_15090 [Novosphingobium colocasiae]